VASSFVAVVVVFVVMGASAALAASLLGDPLDAVTPQIAGQVAGALVLLTLMWRMESLAAAGVTALGSRRWWLITMVIVIYTCACALGSFFGAVVVDLSMDAVAAPVLVHAALAGVVEELLFRGLVLYLLVTAWGGSRRGVVAGVLVSALVFGLSHLLNVASTGPAVTTLQAIEASLSAVLYGALVLSSGSVWPAVAVHSLVNVVVNAAAENVIGFDIGAGDYLAFTVLQVPVVVYAAFLLATLPVPREARSQPIAQAFQ
jgi:membrane protease YdiL (CAAX protease family)